MPQRQVVLFEDRQYYPDAEEVYPDAEVFCPFFLMFKVTVQEEDAMPITEPIIKPLEEGKKEQLEQIKQAYETGKAFFGKSKFWSLRAIQIPQEQIILVKSKFSTLVLRHQSEGRSCHWA